METEPCNSGAAGNTGRDSVALPAGFTNNAEVRVLSGEMPDGLHIHDSSDSIQTELARYGYVGSPANKRLQFDANLTAMRLMTVLECRGPLTQKITYKRLPWYRRIGVDVRSVRERLALWIAPWLGWD